MPISPNFTSIYSKQFEIDFFDCTPDGFIKLSSFCKLIQQASSDHAVHGGISFWDLQKDKQAWVLNKFRLEIKEELPRWQDLITIETWIENLDGIRSTRNFDIFLGKKLIASATSLWVIINTQRRRPEALRLNHDHFVKCEGKNNVEGTFTLFPSQDNEQVQLNEDKVRYSDLDMVDHVTNTKYLEWIIDSMKDNDIILNKIKTVDMLFKKELSFKQQYSIVYKQEEKTQHFFTIKNKNEQINFQCLLESL